MDTVGLDAERTAVGKRYSREQIAGQPQPFQNADCLPGIVTPLALCFFQSVQFFQDD